MRRSYHHPATLGKGVMEILVDGDELMNGFKVHWPNGSDSTYRRAAEGIEMTNCSLAIEDATLGLFVGMYARSRASCVTASWSSTVTSIALHHPSTR